MARGFTLIELLIVVAIIAILAAIAVPNFLEAQTRAKVSRAQADMRSLATALEAYRVDTNRYPPDFEEVTPMTWNPFMNLRVITTPVAYIASLPFDPFDDPLLVYPLDSLASVPGFDYLHDTPGIYDPLRPTAEIPIWNAAGMYMPDITQWALGSFGPDRDGLIDPPYDPTNGTVSNGDILRFGP